MEMYVDYGVSDDCINIWSYGEICVHCGCCSYNTDYKDRLKRQLSYYKECLEEEKHFNNWDDEEKWARIQRKNVERNIIYYKRKIRLIKKILKCCKSHKQ